MTKQIVSILKGYAFPAFGVAEVQFVGEKSAGGKRFGVGTLEDGTPFLFRTEDANIGESSDADDYDGAALPFCFPETDKHEYAAQLREVADWLEKQ